MQRKNLDDGYVGFDLTVNKLITDKTQTFSFNPFAISSKELP